MDSGMFSLQMDMTQLTYGHGPLTLSPLGGALPNITLPAFRFVSVFTFRGSRSRLVISWPGPWAGSQPKPAVKSQAKPEPRGWPRVACGPGFNFGKPLSLALALACILPGHLAWLLA